jgi:tryptophan synthase alpha chain
MSTTLTKNRIEKLFEDKKEQILSVYFSAGYPKLESTVGIMDALEKSGADIIEVGIPFSDPVADGPTIQESNKIALDNGISLKLIFEQLAEIRKSVSIPIIFMGYINPVLQFGLEAFCARCEEIGVDGLILPDLPMQEYLDDYKEIFERHGLLNIFLITPQTSDERVREIDQNSRGFIYMVSSASTTGAKTGISHDQEVYFERIRSMNLENPTLIGFGILNRETFQRACKYASGAIIGSAFINVLSESADLDAGITTFIQSVKGKK